MVRLDLGVTQLLLRQYEEQMPPAACSSGGSRLFIIPAQFHICLFPLVSSLLHGYASLTVTALNILTNRQAAHGSRTVNEGTENNKMH